MLLFHSLPEEDRSNVISYCIFSIIEDMLENGVTLDVDDEESRQDKELLEEAVASARLLPPEEQMDFMNNHECADIIIEIAVDKARSAFYASNDEIVIHYEALREEIKQEASTEEIPVPKKPGHLLN